MAELHLFIVWEKALYKKNDIVNDIKKKFEIIDMYYITWSMNKFSENLSRFYGTKLINNCEKEKHCGKGTFLLIVVMDKNPIYDIRETTAGEELVNINMFDSKVLYRSMTGGGHKVHCTNSVKETNHDLTLLLGKNVDDYLKCSEYKNNKFSLNNVMTINNNLFGSSGFNNVEDMFYVLNNCTEYAILRNYESLPDEIYVNEHNDIDLLCSSKDVTAYILNAKKAQDIDYRVQYYVNVAGTIANFDLRYVGDKYYDEQLEIDILKNRVWNKNGFYTLSEDFYFYTLLYHALIHKQNFSDDYKKRLMKLNYNYDKNIAYSNQKSMEILDKWMIDNRYIIRKPIDKTVFFNENNLRYASRLIYRDFPDKTNDEIYELKEKIRDLEEELNRVKYSRTWRYTGFIRNINRKIKSIKVKDNI